MSHNDLNLQRFVDAQAAIYPQVLTELRQQRKQSHWMWFIFPQLVGLVRSPTAQFYAISDVNEAAAYLAHPLLGSRLRECTSLLLTMTECSVEQVFGFPDNLKLQSSMTLFAACSLEPLFKQVLDQYFAGCADEKTLAYLL